MTQLMLTFKFEAANVNFQQFWDVFNQFQNIVLFDRICRF